MTTRKEDPTVACEPYICPATGETECVCHGGFDNCCDHPRCPGNRDRAAAERTATGSGTADLADMADLLDGHRQQHRPHDGASECSCGQWVGPFSQNAAPGRRFADHLAEVLTPWIARAVGGLLAALGADDPTGGCPTAGCCGDERYAAPGRGHAAGCRYPLPAPADRAVGDAGEDWLARALCAAEPVNTDTTWDHVRPQVRDRYREFAAALAPLLTAHAHTGDAQTGDTQTGDTARPVALDPNRPAPDTDQGVTP